LVVLVSDLIVGRSSSLWVPYVAIAGLLGSLIALYFQWDVTNPVSFLGGFNGDALSVVRGIIIACSLPTILMSIRYIEWHGLAEFITILLTATLGDVLSGANELVMILSR